MSMNKNIQFGTGGFRGVIGDDFNKENFKKRDFTNIYETKKGNTILYFGLICIVVGLIWFAYTLGLIPEIYLKTWPQILLILIGIFLVFKSLTD